MSKAERMQELVEKLEDVMYELGREIHELDIMSDVDCSEVYSNMYYELGKTEGIIAYALEKSGLL